MTLNLNRHIRSTLTRVRFEMSDIKDQDLKCITLMN